MENLLQLLVIVFAFAATFFWLSARKWRRITEQWRGWGSEFSREIAALKADAEVLVAERDALRCKMREVREYAEVLFEYSSSDSSDPVVSAARHFLAITDKET